MSALFTLIARTGGTPMRLVDGVRCPHCGTELLRPTLELAGPRRSVTQRVVCVACASHGRERQP